MDWCNMVFSLVIMMLHYGLIDLCFLVLPVSFFFGCGVVASIFRLKVEFRFINIYLSGREVREPGYMHYKKKVINTTQKSAKKQTLFEIDSVRIPPCILFYILK